MDTMPIVKNNTFVLSYCNNFTPEIPQFQLGKSTNFILLHFFSMEELLSLVIPNKTSLDIDMDPCKVNRPFVRRRYHSAFESNFFLIRHLCSLLPCSICRNLSLLRFFCSTEI